jgi:hypothetical protein
MNEHDLSADELRELLPSLALGAVSDDERVQLERFLAADGAARAELAGYRRAASVLEFDDGPSPAVWTRLRATIADEGNGVVAIEAAPSRRRWGARRVVLSLTAAAAILAVATWGVGRLETASGPTRTVSALQRAAREAVATPGARRLRVASPDGRTAVDVVILPDGQGYVLGGTLPRTRRPSIYALFATTPLPPVLVAVFGSAVHLTAFRLPAGTLGLVVGHTAGRGRPVQPVAVVTLAPICATCAPATAAPGGSSTSPTTGTSGAAPRSPSAPGPSASPPAGAGSGSTPGSLPTLPAVPTLPTLPPLLHQG